MSVVAEPGRAVVQVSAQVVGQRKRSKEETFTIPPSYSQRDTDALMVRKIEDTAFALTWEAYQRTPTRTALLAATARLNRLRQLLGAEGAGDLRDSVRELLEVTNEEATTRWGDDPEGF